QNSWGPPVNRKCGTKEQPQHRILEKRQVASNVLAQICQSRIKFFPLSALYKIMTDIRQILSSIGQLCFGGG
ncbi:MAG: hypothetical protein QF473_36920, partial [Planctomycetota bacterium]|nr:hypothetical protein [Planctomycetota bacterium]